MWTILSTVAVIALASFWRGPNSGWGAIVFGIVRGSVAATVVFIRNAGFHWSIVGKWIVVSVLIGLVLELFGKLSMQTKVVHYPANRSGSAFPAPRVYAVARRRARRLGCRQLPSRFRVWLFGHSHYRLHHRLYI